MDHKLFKLLFLLPCYLVLIFLLGTYIFLYSSVALNEPYAVLNENKGNGSSFVNIIWQSDNECYGVLKYRKAGTKKIFSSESTESSQYHFAGLNEGIEPNTLYEYDVTCDPQQKKFNFQYTFKTFTPSISEIKTIALTTDLITIYGVGHLQILMKAINKYIPEYGPLILAGDYTYHSFIRPF